MIPNADQTKSIGCASLYDQELSSVIDPLWISLRLNNKTKGTSFCWFLFSHHLSRTPESLRILMLQEKSLLNKMIRQRVYAAATLS